MDVGSKLTASALAMAPQHCGLCSCWVHLFPLLLTQPPGYNVNTSWPGWISWLQQYGFPAGHVWHSAVIKATGVAKAEWQAKSTFCTNYLWNAQSNQRNAQVVPQNYFLDVCFDLLYCYLPWSPQLIYTAPDPNQNQQAQGIQRHRNLVVPEHACPMVGFALLQLSFCHQCHLPVSRCCADFGLTFCVYEGSDLIFLCLYLVTILLLME